MNEEKAETTVLKMHTAPRGFVILMVDVEFNDSMVFKPLVVNASQIQSFSTDDSLVEVILNDGRAYMHSGSSCDLAAAIDSSLYFLRK